MNVPKSRPEGMRGKGKEKKDGKREKRVEKIIRLKSWGGKSPEKGQGGVQWDPSYGRKKEAQTSGANIGPRHSRGGATANG